MIPIPNPPELTGTHEQQLKQLWDWAFQLVEILKINFDNIGGNENGSK